MPSPKSKAPKKRNAQDLTLRNLRAMKKTLTRLERRVQRLERQR